MYPLIEFKSIIRTTIEKENYKIDAFSLEWKFYASMYAENANQEQKMKILDIECDVNMC